MSEPTVLTKELAEDLVTSSLWGRYVLKLLDVYDQTGDRLDNEMNSAYLPWLQAYRKGLAYAIEAPYLAAGRQSPLRLKRQLRELPPAPVPEVVFPAEAELPRVAPYPRHSSLA